MYDRSGRAVQGREANPGLASQVPGLGADPCWLLAAAATGRVRRRRGRGRGGWSSEARASERGSGAQGTAGPEAPREH